MLYKFCITFINNQKSFRTRPEPAKTNATLNELPSIISFSFLNHLDFQSNQFCQSNYQIKTDNEKLKEENSKLLLLSKTQDERISRLENDKH